MTRVFGNWDLAKRDSAKWGITDFFELWWSILQISSEESKSAIQPFYGCQRNARKNIRSILILGVG